MSETGKRSSRREKSCRKCFAYIPSDSRKCKFCGYKYKTSSRYLFDKLKRALHVDHAHSVERAKQTDKQRNLFTRQEIENLLRMNDFRVQMYLVLDDIAFLDEMALIELGETLMALNEN